MVTFSIHHHYKLSPLKIQINNVSYTVAVVVGFCLLSANKHHNLLVNKGFLRSNAESMSLEKPYVLTSKLKESHPFPVKSTMKICSKPQYLGPPGNIPALEQTLKHRLRFSCVLAQQHHRFSSRAEHRFNICSSISERQLISPALLQIPQ